MYSLSIHFGPSPVPAQFLFKDKEKAVAASKNVVSGSLVIEDDYGQTASIVIDDIHGTILEDMDLGEESRIQRGLSQARGQAKANERAKTDPILLKAMGVRGPSVLTPFGNGQFGNG